ncbi:MAG TPA: hypothetical protein VGJ30_17015 [Candidatus Angelobacter sp.]
MSSNSNPALQEVPADLRVVLCGLDRDDEASWVAQRMPWSDI